MESGRKAVHWQCETLNRNHHELFPEDNSHVCRNDFRARPLFFRRLLSAPRDGLLTISSVLNQAINEELMAFFLSEA